MSTSTAFDYSSKDHWLACRYNAFISGIPRCLGNHCGDGNQHPYCHRIVCFRQSSVMAESVSFFLGWIREDTAHGGATDVEAAGDLGFAASALSETDPGLLSRIDPPVR